MYWLIDGNNVYGSRPDGWWNDRDGAAKRFAQCVAEWCRTHDDDVTLVFDAPVSNMVLMLGGGNLTIRESQRKGRDAADDLIVQLSSEVASELMVVSSDKGLRARLPDAVLTMGVGGFREIVGY